MHDPRDPSWIFDGDREDRHGLITMSDGRPLSPGIPRFFDGLAEVGNATIGEGGSGGIFTRSCWKAINEVLPLGPDQLACAGWSTYHSDMPGGLSACYGSPSLDFTLQPGSDADWMIWLTTARQAESCGSPNGNFLSPSLWFSPEELWVVMGGSIEPMSIVAASTTVIDDLTERPDLSVHVLAWGPSR